MTLSWELPYSANRSPVFAENLLASSQPLAVQAGLSALRDGGNAVDAALATAITLTVVEPNNNGLGSDAFALVHDGKALHGLNASGRSPALLDPAMFKGQQTMPTLGWDSVTVPGAVSAWVALSERFGALPFERLFQDAIRYAEQGFPVGPKTGHYWQLAAKTYQDFQPFLDTFTLGGRAPAVGERMRLPDHAKSLRRIAASKGEDFYRGELAEAIAADAAQWGAALTAEDLAAHQCDWVSPLASSGFGVELHEMPPSSQGLMALVALGIAARTGLEALPLDSPDSLHLQIEAMRIAYADMAKHLADVDAMAWPPQAFLEPAYLEGRAAEISRQKANPSPYALGASPDTVYLTCADASGMMVSMIQSNYMGFGSGIVIPNTGIAMQNRGAGFVLEEGHANQVGPGKRPFHTIIPGFVTKDAQPLMSFGVMGGHAQAQGHLQMVVRVCLHGQNPQAASDAPRWHLLQDGRVAMEAGFSNKTLAELERRGHQLVLGSPEHLFGGAQLLVKTEAGYVGGSDHRKEGQAAGF